MADDIRTLTRGLAIVETLSDTGSLSLAEIHRQVGLPKPTILRMMRTLESRGWVYRRHGDGRYQLRANLRLRARPPRQHEWLAQVAGPHLDQLQTKTGWPSALGVPDGTRMLILETASYSAGLIVNYRTVGVRPYMLWSALGRAYFAFCAPAERLDALDALQRSRDPKDEVARLERWVQRLLATVRGNGYGTRDPRYLTPNDPAQGSLAAIAIPVGGDGRAVAAVNIVWPRVQMTEEDACGRYLEPLREAVGRIEREIAAQTPSTASGQTTQRQ